MPRGFSKDGTANLKPWKPGQSGNPNGRPRKRPLSEAYDDWLRQPVSTDQIIKLREQGVRLPEDTTNADMVALSQGREAMSGNTNAAREMREAVEGKATQRFELSHTNDRAPEFLVVYANAVPGLPAAEPERQAVEAAEVAAERVLEQEVIAAVIANQDEDGEKDE